MRTKIIEAVRNEKLIVIVRGVEKEKLIPLAQAMYDGGIRMLEITYDARKKDSDTDTARSIERLASAFEGKLLIGAGTVLTEEQALSCASFARYTEMLKDFTLEGGASAMLTELRLIKDEGELETIARAQAITDAAFSHILTVLHPEMTEIEVALELEFFMRRNGAEDIAFSTIAVSGTNSARPHGVPRRCRLERGFLTMDFGAKADGYCSDMTRTVFLGRADAEEKKLYDTVLRAQTAALDALSEGASCRELDAVARNIIDGAGYKGLFGHSLGHGVGMFIHENPRLSSAAKPESVLKRGHVVTVEPGIYVEGKYGCRIEDMVAISHDGSVRNFTKSKKELIELF